MPDADLSGWLNHVKNRRDWEAQITRHAQMTVDDDFGKARAASVASPVVNSPSTLQVTKPSQAVDDLLGELTRLLGQGARASHLEVHHLASKITQHSSRTQFVESSGRLNQACFHLFQIGHSSLGIGLGKAIAQKAEHFGDIATHRRTANIIGLQYGDIADFASSMQYLQLAVMLSRKLADATLEAACLANVITVLQEMGHYRQAISMAESILELDDVSHMARMLKLQCASNGLFAAHRIGDIEMANRFLLEGQRHLSVDTEPFRRAYFDKARVLYLIDLGQHNVAKQHLDAVMIDLKDEDNPRITTLLTIASSICGWSLGERSKARSTLAMLRDETKKSRLNHHFVLQALVKVYSDAATLAEATTGLAYARELVEYTTSVKKAKFYRQLAHKREESDQRASAQASTTVVDPFDVARDWLIASDIRTPSTDVDGDVGERRVLTKHEELTVIHEDMAKLRAATLRRDIRTDAVDTAENWAIAAEFFDDETGQHCYRVGHLAAMLAREVGLDETFCIRVEHAARLHDIGKIAVNEVILLKPGPLDAAEMAAMRLHTEVGAQLLSGSDDPTLLMAVDVARHHHEWWNGGGYPARLSGTNIPVAARLCALADVYDALTHARAYKKAWTHERAMEEMLRLGTTQFDPSLIKSFCTVVERYRADLESHAIPAFKDMDSNALIVSRKKLMETIAAAH